jgi:hypothetical protein
VKKKKTRFITLTPRQVENYLDSVDLFQKGLGGVSAVAVAVVAVVVVVAGVVSTA